MKETTDFYSPEIFTGELDLTKKWFVYYYEPLVNGHVPKRVRVYGGINRIKTIEGRIKKAGEICDKIRTGKPVKFGKRPPIVKIKKGILLDTLDSMENYVAPKTIVTYCGMVRKFHEFLGDKSDSQVTMADADLFIKKLFEKKMSNKTIKAYRNNLKTLYNKYIKKFEPEGFKNPFRNSQIIKTSSRSLMYYNDLQIGLIKEYCKKNNHMLWVACLLQYYCFIRPNELRQLKVEDINIHAGYIEIPGTVSKNRKTQKVAIPDGLLPELNFLMHHDPELFVFGGPGPVPPSRDRLSKAHKKVLEELNIKGRYGFYSWKHTGATKAYLAGINMKDLQLQLRHHSLDMVNEYLKNLGVMDNDRIKTLFPKI